ncbi:hypothetical protein SNEBB_007514 [Seison nebaliae]|nr:hypothetical protein SNEBB_007514 [Seison nebaliae]
MNKILQIKLNNLRRTWPILKQKKFDYSHILFRQIDAYDEDLKKVTISQEKIDDIQQFIQYANRIRLNKAKDDHLTMYKHGATGLSLEKLRQICSKEAFDLLSSKKK